MNNIEKSFVSPFAPSRIHPSHPVDKTRKPDVIELARDSQKQPAGVVNYPSRIETPVDITSQKIADAATRRTDRTEALTDLKRALKQSHDQHDQIKKQIATGPDHLDVQQNAKNMSQGVDALHSACKSAIEALEQSSRAIKMHLTDIETRTKVIRDLLDLNDLMTKYEDRDKLDLTKPRNDSEIQDFQRMSQLRDLAVQNGIQWDCLYGWNSKKDEKRYASGIASLVGALQAQNKVKDLQMQQSVSVYQAYVLLCSNMILTAAQLQKDIVRNINR